MMKRLFLLLIVALFAVPSFAGHADCTSVLVTEGVCRDATNHVFYFDAPNVTFAELRDAIATQQGWASLMICTDDLVRAGICSVGELETEVAVAKDDFAEGWVKRILREVVISQRKGDDVQTAIDAVDTDVDVGD